MIRPAPSSSSESQRYAWRETAAIFLIFMVAGGAAAPHVNESHYLAKAKRYWDASYCPGDFFLGSADPHLAFYWSTGWLTQLLPLTAVAWVGRMAAWGLLAFGWQRLSASVVRAPWSAAVSAALWVMLLRNGIQNFSGEWVVGGIEAKSIAYGFFLLGMAALVRGDWRRPWIWFGAASAFHVLVGGWAVLAALGVWLTGPRHERASWRPLVPSLLAGGALSLIGLVPTLTLEWHAEPAVRAEAARIYVFDRLPHHLAPLSLPAPELRRRLQWLGGLMATLVGTAIWLRRRADGVARGAPAAIASTHAAARAMRFAAFALAGAAAGLAIELTLEHEPLAAARVLRYYWFRQLDVALPLAIAIVGSGWVVTMWRSGAPWARVAALLPPLLSASFLAHVSHHRWQSNVPPGLQQVENVTAWIEAGEWIAGNTPSDARFLIPRWGHTFKWYASRADVASYKDVPQDAVGVLEWRTRMRALFPTIDAPGERGRQIVLDSPERLGTSRVLELAKRYGASHVLARSAPRLDLPVVFETARGADHGGYVVYEAGVPRGAIARPDRSGNSSNRPTPAAADLRSRQR
jgi:hypothetical protein